MLCRIGFIDFIFLFDNPPNQVKWSVQMVSITAACLGKASCGAMILLEKNPKPG